MARTSSEYKKLSINEFTRAAEKYETDKAGIYELCKEDYPEIIAILKDRPFTDLLDAGCGPAPLLSALCELYPEKHFTGLDLTPAMIDKAKAKNLPNAEFYVGDCENLPFPEASFDVIVCCESFHHYPNPQDFFNSVHRCLRPGGMLILRDYAADGFVGLFMNRIELPMVNFFGHGDVRISSEAGLRTMCANAGLTVERFEQLKGMKMNLIASKPGISG